MSAIALLIGESCIVLFRRRKKTLQITPCVERGGNPGLACGRAHAGVFIKLALQLARNRLHIRPRLGDTAPDLASMKGLSRVANDTCVAEIEASRIFRHVFRMI